MPTLTGIFGGSPTGTKSSPSTTGLDAFFSNTKPQVDKGRNNASFSVNELTPPPIFAAFERELQSVDQLRNPTFDRSNSPPRVDTVREDSGSNQSGTTGQPARGFQKVSASLSNDGLISGVPNGALVFAAVGLFAAIVAARAF